MLEPLKLLLTYNGIMAVSIVCSFSLVLIVLLMREFNDIRPAHIVFAYMAGTLWFIMIPLNIIALIVKVIKYCRNESEK